MTTFRFRRGPLAAAALLVSALAIGGVALPSEAAPKGTTDLQILSFNDYHGHLQPPTGSDGTLVTSTGTTTAGGVEYLTSHLRQLRQGHKNTLTVAAGDLIGGSPFLSGLFKDEPSVESLDNLGLDVSSVGNHEFDEGVTELLRMQYGGCHPTEGCYDGDGYSGAEFPWLAANVAYKNGVTPPKPVEDYGSWFKASTGRTVLPPTWVKSVQGTKVGFIGMTLEGTPELVAQAGIQDVTFADEVATANLAAQDLRRKKVEAIVVLLHEGGLPPAGAAFDYNCNAGSSAALSGPIVTIAKNLDPSIDLVVSGHTHQPYTCNIPDPAGQARWVTSASSFGRVITETNLKLDRATGDVIRSSVQSVEHAVTRDVTPAADQTATITKWNTLAGPVGNKVIGSITADITRGGTAGSRRDVESSLSDLIADAQLAATSAAGAGGAQLALMNPGGVRADLVYAGSTAGEGDGNVTYGESFTVQPFGNLLVSMTLTGSQIERVLEQQWVTQSDGSVRFLHLGPSSGFHWSWSASAPVGSKIDPASITLNGAPVDPAASYRVTVNSFLADGGDGFTVFREGTNRVGGGVDLDAFNAYLGANSPVAPPAATRVTPLP
ncbi:bifunctional metallophosphatase/5'-nucleotidase [Nocardioides guangzhouensis]|uniref:Bifunctional metallophosphatase/5'-nucleotidase n=1 Tax=Nocardioides guangzhouensis TaxID=2497878 RepID=A0A4Q4ZFM4_9ACTN|nr:bifunctional metallophosphatase/5'-nucleotidase [Nocardioides guangzhouensis]RYP86923.1 bifunctional metallophosphatase/5'-nucleotidase [Nocardioides guangzhouensis]